MARKRDEPRTTPDLEGGKTFTVKTQSGRYREIPGRQCDDWRPGQSADDRWRPDFSTLPPCDRCQGYGDKEGWHHGGHIPVVVWELDYAWYTRIAACDCVFGAWLAQTNKMRFYDDSPHALPGLGWRDMRILEAKLRGLRREPGGLRKAAEAILEADTHDRVMRAIEEREQREQREGVPERGKPKDPAVVSRIQALTNTLAEAKGWPAGWRGR